MGMCQDLYPKNETSFLRVHFFKVKEENKRTKNSQASALLKFQTHIRVARVLSLSHTNFKNIRASSVVFWLLIF